MRQRHGEPTRLGREAQPLRSRSGSSGALATVLTPEIEERMLAHTPLKRLGETEDIAGAVLYFAAPVSKWVSGQVLFVNGGGVQTLD